MYWILKSSLFPKTHRVLIAVLSLCLCPLVIARFVDQSGPAQYGPLQDRPALSLADTGHAAIPEVAPDIRPVAPTGNQSSAERGKGTTTGALRAHAGRQLGNDTDPPPGGTTTETLRVHAGDSLAKLFKRKGIPAKDLHSLVNTPSLGDRLKSIHPGHQLTITTNPNNSLVKFSYSPSALEKLEFQRVGDMFEGAEKIVSPERVGKYYQGTIDENLFAASQRAGLGDTQTMRLAEIFQWDIDFVHDIRAGDSFHILLEELYLEGQLVGYGDIRVAEFVNRGETLRTVLYKNKNGESTYFDSKGQSMHKAFLRAPVSFTRISSNFNLRRRHPLWNQAMPHRGIDYAAPTGTPVLAAGDGTVIKAGRTKANGNYIVIRHDERFVTKYLHLSRFARGTRANAFVRQGQTIGYVGATGWATGPHLHYEFLVDGIHQNPRTVRLPDAESIPAQEMEHFIRTTAPLFALLDSSKQVQLAHLSH